MVFTYDYDEQGNQLRWRSENYARDDRGREMRFDWWPNGQLQRRRAIKQLDQGEETKRTYEYTYNPNRSLVKVIDLDADRLQDGSQRRVTEFGRDDAEREVAVDERFDAGDQTPASDRFGDSRYVYDTYTGLLVRRETDGVLDEGSLTGASKKVTVFDHDALGREWRMSVTEADRPGRVTRTAWHDSGAMRWRRKPNATRDVWEWNALGDKTAHERVRQTPGVDPAGDPPATDMQGYAYDRDGNRTVDERGEHRFNSRDQLVFWKHEKGANAGWSTSYEVDGSGQILGSVDRNTAGTPRVSTVNDFDGDRLEKSTVTQSLLLLSLTTTRTYRYDDSGNVQRIYTHSTLPLPAPDKTALSPDDCKRGDDVPLASSTVRYCYDEFNRQIFAAGPGISDPAHITYDGLDRRATKQTQNLLGQPVKSTAYSYLGSSERVTSQRAHSGSEPQPSKTHTYDYDSQGARTGQATNQAQTYRPYATDANGSVTGLESDTGTISDADSYTYTPYGDLDKPGTDPEGSLSAAARDNPFRFQGFYYDSGTKTYDMHARAYRPDTGRFLSQDIYASAAGDQALQADPLTQNRYAFAGANPVTNVEFDGHDPHALDTHGRARVPKPGGGHYKRTYAQRDASRDRQRIRIEAAEKLEASADNRLALLAAFRTPDGEQFANDVLAADADELDAARKIVRGEDPDARSTLEWIGEGTLLAADIFVGKGGVAATRRGIKSSYGKLKGLLGGGRNATQQAADRVTANLRGIKGNFSKNGNATRGGPGGAGPVRVGQAGENAVRGAYDIGPKVPIRVGGRDRIPDGLTTSTLSEVKNVASLSYSRQLRDYVSYAQQSGRQVDLFVRGGSAPTRLSGPLRDALRDPSVPINLRFIP